METHISRAPAAYSNVRLCMGTGTSRSVCPSFSVTVPVSLCLCLRVSLWVSVPGARGRPGPLGSRRTSLSCRMVGAHLDSQPPFLSLLKKITYYRKDPSLSPVWSSTAQCPGDQGLWAAGAVALLPGGRMLAAGPASGSRARCLAEPTRMGTPSPGARSCGAETCGQAGRWPS